MDRCGRHWSWIYRYPYSLFLISLLGLYYGSILFVVRVCMVHVCWESLYFVLLLGVFPPASIRLWFTNSASGLLHRQHSIDWLNFNVNPLLCDWILSGFFCTWLRGSCYIVCFFSQELIWRLIRPNWDFPYKHVGHNHHGNVTFKKVVITGPKELAECKSAFTPEEIEKRGITFIKK